MLFYLDSKLECQNNSTVSVSPLTRNSRCKNDIYKHTELLLSTSVSLLLLLWELCRGCRKMLREMAPVEHRKNQGSLFEDDSLKHLSLRHCIVAVAVVD